MNALVVWVLLAIAFLYPKSAFAQVVINEFSSASSDDDWVELYSSEDIDISGWVLDDENTSTEIYTFPENSKIGPSTNSYVVVDKSVVGKIYNRLGNSNDKITLYRLDLSVGDEVAYGLEDEVCAPDSIESSVARIPDGGNVLDRLQNSTKGITNGISVTNPCPSPTPLPTNTPTPTPKPSHTPTPQPTSKPVSTPKPTTTSKPISTVTLTPTMEPTNTSSPTATSIEETTGVLKNEVTDVSTSTDNNTKSEVLGVKTEEKSSKLSIAPLLMVLGGLIIMISPFFPAIKNRFKKLK